MFTRHLLDIRAHNANHKSVLNDASIQEDIQHFGTKLLPLLLSQTASVTTTSTTCDECTQRITPMPYVQLTENANITVNEIITGYFQERTSILSLVLEYLGASNSDSIIATIVQSHWAIDEKFPLKVLDQIKTHYLYLQTITTTRSPHDPALVIKQVSTELVLLWSIVLHLMHVITFKGSHIVVFMGKITDLGFVNLTSTWSSLLEEETTTQIQLLATFSILAMLNVDKIIADPDKTCTKHPLADVKLLTDIEVIIRQIPLNEKSGLLYLFMSAFMTQILENSDSSSSLYSFIKEGPGMNRHYAQIACQSNVIQYWSTNAPYEYQMMKSGICQVMAVSVLQLFTQSFDTGALNLSASTEQSKAKLVDSSSSNFITRIHDISPKILPEMLLDALSMFPRTSTFLCVLARAMLDSEEYSRHTLQLMFDLSIYDQDAAQVDPLNADYVGEDTIRVHRTFKVCPNVLLEVGTLGLYVREGNDAHVQWQESYSIWDIVSQGLDEMLKLRSVNLKQGNSDIDKWTSYLHLSASLLEAYEKSAQLLAAASRAEFEETVMFPLADKLARVFEKLSRSTSVVVLPLLEHCLAFFIPLAKVFPTEIWTFMKVARIIPEQGRGGDMVMMTQCSVALIKTQIERKASTYTVTKQFMRLLNTLHYIVKVQSMHTSDNTEHPNLNQLVSLITYMMSDVVSDVGLLKFQNQLESYLFMVQAFDTLTSMMRDFAPIIAALSENLSVKSHAVAKFSITLQPVLQPFLMDTAAHRLTSLFSMIPDASDACQLFDRTNGIDLVTHSLIFMSLLFTYRDLMETMCSGVLLHAICQIKVGAGTVFDTVIGFVSFPERRVSTLAKEICCQVLDCKKQQVEVRVSDHLDGILSHVSPKFSAESIACSLQVISMLPSYSFETKRLLPALELLLGKINDYLRSDPALAAQWLNVYSMLAKNGTSNVEIIKTLGASDVLWKVVKSVVDMDSSLYDDQELAYNVFYAKSQAYRLLSVMLSNTSQEFERVTKISTYLCQEDQVKHTLQICQFLNDIKAQEVVAGLQLYSPLNLLVFSSRTWASSVNKSITYGPLYIYATNFVEDYDHDVASVLGEVNFSLSVCESQLQMVAEWSRMMSEILKADCPRPQLVKYLLLVLETFKSLDFGTETMTSIGCHVANVLHSIVERWTSISTEAVQSEDLIPFLPLLVQLMASIYTDFDLHDLQNAESHSVYFVWRKISECTVLLAGNFEQTGAASKLCAKSCMMLIEVCSRHLSHVQSHADFEGLDHSAPLTLILFHWTLGLQSFASKTHRFMEPMVHSDLFRSLIGFLSWKSNSKGMQQSLVTLLTTMANISECAQELANLELLRHVMRLDVKFYSSAFQSELSLAALMIESLHGSDLIVSSAIQLFEVRQELIAQTLAIKNTTLTARHKFVQLTKSRLQSISRVIQLFVALVSEMESWFRRLTDTATFITTSSLLLLRDLVEILIHPNLFSQTVCTVYGTEKSSSVNAPTSPVKKVKHDMGSEYSLQMRHEVLSLLRKVVVVLFTVSRGMHPFTTPLREWDFANLVFQPSVDSSSSSETVTLGTLSSLASYCSERLRESGRKGKADEEDDLLASSLDIVCTLLVSQLTYALRSPNFSPGQIEQILVETGGSVCGTLTSVVDLQERFGPAMPVSVKELLQSAKSLKSFVENCLLPPFVDR